MKTDAMLWNDKAPAPSPRKPGELLFEFVSKAGSPMACELHLRVESYSYEVEFHRRGEPLFRHGAFATREAAVRWAMEQRDAIQQA